LLFTQFNAGAKEMLFRIGEKEYSGESALDIVDALQMDMLEGNPQHLSLRDFLLWSMSQLCDRVPSRELDVSDKLNNETLALNYLYLRDEYGVGELTGTPGNDRH
jgi:hypothetical protein